MSNLTLSVEEATLRRARIRAIEQGTSINAVVRSFLESHAGVDDERRAIRSFLAIGEEAGAGAAENGRRWRREELYEDRTRWPRS